MERRHSTDSSDSSQSNKHTSTDEIPAQSRVSKVTSPKPPANALQFVKVGPCDLYRSAQEQLKKVEEIKKAKKEVRDDAEDWQYNLDNWKCNRRKRQEHIIERVVEVKKLELEEHERNKRKNKTFSEMLQDRTARGRNINLVVHDDDSANDLTDLGLSSKENGSQESSGHESSDQDTQECLTNGHSEKDSNKKSSSSESEEYTYERAIQSYVNFAEQRMKCTKSEETKTNGPSRPSPPVPEKPRRASAKIELLRERSASTTDIPDPPKKPIVIPKVDVNKRRELFEKGADDEKKEKSPDVPSAKSIKERLSSLERQVKEAVKESKPDPLPVQSIKERLSSLERSKLTPPKEPPPQPPTIKERLTSLQNIEVTREECLKAQCTSTEFAPDEIFEKKQPHFRHRSLDSLDVDSDIVQTDSFERVQSYEDLEYCRNYPASSLSGDTDREDSGIHTADVSSSVSQADDYDLHLEGGVMDELRGNHQPTIEEEIKGDKGVESGYSLADIASELGETEEVPQETSSQDTALPPHSPALLAQNSPVVLREPKEATQTPADDKRHTVYEVFTKMDTYDFKSPPVTPFLNVDSPNFPEDKSPSDTSNLDSTLLSSSANYNEDHYNELNNSAKQNNAANLLDAVIENKENLSYFPLEKPIPEPRHLNESGLILPNLPLYVSPEQTTLTELVFNMSVQEQGFQLSPSALEPPKEKPPPPPVDLSDDESKPKSPSIRRLDSTKRIKKEIRQKRSSFLGIDGGDDYLEPELELPKPPDMTTILAEERRLERQLYRQSVCSETDSNQESRDSGVELDNNKTHDVMVWNHSRNNSETYGNQSTTSEEDEIIRKEREIIETLEREEQIRKQNLAMRLRELEAEKDRVLWDRIQDDQTRNLNNYVMNSDPVLLEEGTLHEERYDRPRAEIAETRNESQWFANGNDSIPEIHSRNLQAMDLPANNAYISELEYPAEYRNSYHDLSCPEPPLDSVVSKGSRQPNNLAYHRRSMPDLQQLTPRRPPPPPPVLPARVLKAQPQARSAQPLTPSGPQQMTKQTLHALSAAPRSRLISNESWQAKRTTKPRQDNCNYQHWLIQEAEHRRITEQHKRQMKPSVPAVQARVPQVGMPPPQSAPIVQAQWSQDWNPLLHRPNYTSAPREAPRPRDKPLPDSIIQSLTQRVNSRISQSGQAPQPQQPPLLQHTQSDSNNNRRQRYEAPTYPAETHQDKVLSVSGKKRCSACGDELGRGAAMIIESLQLFYHIECFKCCVCCMQLGDGLMGTDVRVRNNKLHCHNCYSSDDGVKFSCV